MSISAQEQIRHLQRFSERVDRRLSRINGISTLYSRIRLGFAAIGVLAVFFVYRSMSQEAGLLVGAAFVAGFIVIARLHNRVILSIRKHQYFGSIKATHIERINREWDEIPRHSELAPDSQHPFASDLNVLGDRSLHHLIDTSFSKEGSQRLADWLTRSNTDPVATDDQRSIVSELVPLSAFRDRISLLSALVSHDQERRWEGRVLLDWLKTTVDSKRLLLVFRVLSALAVLTPILIVLHYVAGIDHWWAATLFAYVSIYLLNTRLYDHLFDEAEHIYYQLMLFSPVIQFIERFKFRPGSRLETLVDPFQNVDTPASAYVKKAMWLSVAASTQKSEVLRVVLNLIMPWEILFSLLLHRYKKTLVDRLPLWLDVLQRLEAASSLANFADLNPAYIFPDVRAKSQGNEPVFRALQMGHPLIPRSDVIANDFTLMKAGDIALVTGSNMSGKSTFLRTLGTNLCLAYAGGPVDAVEFSCLQFRLFTCINVIDSVNDGISYFYAEVRRLKELLTEVDKGDTYPLFFLVDEVFRGTNNRERYIGGRSLLLALSKTIGSGAVSTHDLELVKLEDDTPSIMNYHFREHIEGGKMIFDYLLRTGPCPTTNALKIMRLEGLPVDDPSTPSAD